MCHPTLSTQTLQLPARLRNYVFFLKCSFILIASVLTNEYNMVDSPRCLWRESVWQATDFISKLLRHATFLQDKVYQPPRQRIWEMEIYCIMHREHCELNLYFWLFIFHVRDWIQQSQWQTAGKLMRGKLQQPMKISRWGVMWPKMTPITRWSNFMNSFEASNFMMISRCGEWKKCFLHSQDDFLMFSFFYYFFSPECHVPSGQFTTGQFRLWGSF